ncbi:low-density lipoprotein receptor class A domain-containing protein 3-like [Amphibalanus amphitrite]|uniref:low-density lipoprotein receptor class A domain-containing protein 3-like n=1 Tax=Amphibalanus amphitrite TaxID=1232801 RepID=UPI001C910DC4|nr:low-density lipoprotein receptor class A domain-containing protein 3-like [Amphibalanus amphitrite]XP_043196019.1 low-density lipoprotein receptor class A domain-containing protein 3-like [Amphibalanus amphitrite]
MATPLAAAAGPALLMLQLLAATSGYADESSESPPPSGLPPLDTSIRDEQAMQVDGKTIVRDLGSTLNLTCRLNWTGQQQTLHAVPKIAWYLPTSDQPERIRKERLEGGLRLSVTNLLSHDSGNFSCETQLADETIVLKSFILYVRPPGCSDGQFQCQGLCINRVFVCDGKADCPDGLDEMLETCGKHVTCDDAGRSGGGQLIKCGERCRPRHFCCYQGNCSTGRYINEDEPCCKHIIGFSTGQYRPHDLDKTRPRHDDQSGAYDRTYLETAIYTIIGCAVAFILIVSIMIVAFCRVHLRQSARLSSYSHMRAARAAAAHPPLADFDHLMMAGGGAHFPAYYGGGPGHMMVTYNINNGVQVMPLISPPSYSEAVQGQVGGSLETHRAAAAAPSAGAPQPNAGPPPPYASRETLAEPSPAYAGSENNNGDINGNSVSEAAEAPAPPRQPRPAAPVEEHVPKTP